MTAWPRVQLDKCGEVIGGATPKTSRADYWEGNIPWVTPKDLSGLEGCYLDDTPRKLSSKGLDSCAARLLPPGSVLLSSRAPIGHTAINTVPMATNQGFKSIVPRPGILEARYLLYWLRANRLRLQEMGEGATFKELSKARVEQIQIPLPPMDEQRRIADVLDRTGELRATRRTALEELETLKRSIFLDMFGDPRGRSGRWPTKSVGDYVQDFVAGRSMGTDDSGAGELRVLKVSAVKKGRFVPTESKPVKPSYEAPGDHFVRPGDLLFSRANVAPLVGDVAYVFECPPELLVPDKLWRVQWREPRTAHALFVWALFTMPTMRQEFERRATGTSGSMKNISQEKVMNVRTILPPLDRQVVFAEAVTRVEGLRKAAERSAAEVGSLIGSLQVQAFTDSP